MAITAGALLGKVSQILLDESNVRWPVTTEMIGWLDTAQRTACLLKPDLLTTTAPVQLAAGTKQTLPAAANAPLIAVTRNMGAAGSTPGAAITPIDKDVLDALLPGWGGNALASAVVKHYMRDPRNPKTFYVYPAQPAPPAYVEIVYPIAPTALTKATDNLSLDDIYEGVLIDYCLYRAYSKDSLQANAAGQAAAHRQAFFDALGIRNQAEAALRTPQVVASQG